MKYITRRSRVYIINHEAETETGRIIDICSYDGYHDRVCEWIVWPGDGGKAIAKGVCYGVKEAKKLAEQAARDYDAKERVK